MDSVDRAIVHALQVDGRASFSRIGEVLGVADRTVARRYRQLRSTGVVRVVGAVHAGRLGWQEWLVRVRCRPGAAAEVATALARRDDTAWVGLLSGGTEISCAVRSPSDAERDELVLHRLQRTAPVLSITAHAILHTFMGGPVAFRGAEALTAAQVAALEPRLGPAVPVEALTDRDRALVASLARDGRATAAVLAGATGWSESTVTRRVDALRAAGLLYLDVDVLATALGFAAEARLWASVPPAELAAAGAALAGHPEVAFAAATTGPTNLVASVVCRDNADLYRYLTERAGALPLVRELETAPVLRVVKRAGALL